MSFLSRIPFFFIIIFIRQGQPINDKKKFPFSAVNSTELTIECWVRLIGLDCMIMG